MKISERWHHVIVDRENHPRYVVRDAEGRMFRANVRFLTRDHTEVGGAEGRQPREPSSRATKTGEESAPPEPESMIIMRSECPEEKWRLAMVAKNQDGCAGGQLRVHYFNRADRAAAVENQTWRPAYLDVRDRHLRDVCTYSPKHWYEPYLRVVRADSVLLTGVALTKGDHISRVDLRRLSADARVDWVYNPLGEDDEPMGPGVWVLEDEGRRGKFVGRVIAVHGEGGGDRCQVQFEDGRVVWRDMGEAVGMRRAFQQSGFAHTVGWKSATPGVRQLRRLDQKLAKRALKINPKRERWKARQEMGELESTEGEGPG